LNTKRAQLGRIKAHLTLANDYNKKIQNKGNLKKLYNIDKPIIKELDAAIDNIDAEMLALVKSSDEVYDNYKIAHSAPGVGKIIAIAFNCATNNFTKFVPAKALGNYIGVVPFRKESERYSGRYRVSQIAYKSLKTLLHLGVISVVKP